MREVLLGGALIFKEMDGNVLPEPFNSDTVNRYFYIMSILIFLLKGMDVIFLYHKQLFLQFTLLA